MQEREVVLSTDFEYQSLTFVLVESGIQIMSFSEK
jgi:hypothetical protein